MRSEVLATTVLAGKANLFGKGWQSTTVAHCTHRHFRAGCQDRLKRRGGGSRFGRLRQRLDHGCWLDVKPRPTGQSTRRPIQSCCPTIHRQLDFLCQQAGTARFRALYHFPLVLLILRISVCSFILVTKYHVFSSRMFCVAMQTPTLQRQSTCVWTAHLPLLVITSSQSSTVTLERQNSVPTLERWEPEATYHLPLTS